MTTTSLTNPDLFKILDETENKTYYGCNQAWYPSKWQRMSGCGPSVASNILFYYCLTRSNFGLAKVPRTREGFLSLMQDVWKYVTPTPLGIPKTSMFYRGMRRFANAFGLNINHQVYNVPKRKAHRPPITEVLAFIETALKEDCPVAFLNLCNGKLSHLEKWHWVTLIALEYDDYKTWATVLDQGHLKKIDLTLWYDTTTMGGGFVYFSS